MRTKELLLTALIVCCIQFASGGGSHHDEVSVRADQPTFNFYISPQGKETNNCTQNSPCLTIDRALLNCTGFCVIIASPGTYVLTTVKCPILLDCNVTILGSGFDKTLLNVSSSIVIVNEAHFVDLTISGSTDYFFQLDNSFVFFTRALITNVLTTTFFSPVTHTAKNSARVIFRSSVVSGLQCGFFCWRDIHLNITQTTITNVTYSPTFILTNPPSGGKIQITIDESCISNTTSMPYDNGNADAWLFSLSQTDETITNSTICNNGAVISRSWHPIFTFVSNLKITNSYVQGGYTGSTSCPVDFSTCPFVLQPSVSTTGVFASSGNNGITSSTANSNASSSTGGTASASSSTGGTASASTSTACGILIMMSGLLLV